MRLKNNLRKYSIPLVFGIGIIYLICINYRDYCFNKMNLNDIITLCLLFYVSYYLVERNNDRRILKEKIELTLSVIDDDLAKINKNLFVETFEPKDYTVISKRISNKILLLKNYARKFDIVKEVDYIEESFQGIDKMIGNHINKLDELKSILIDIENTRDQIKVRMDNIFMKLY